MLMLVFTWRKLKSYASAYVAIEIQAIDNTFSTVKVRQFFLNLFGVWCDLSIIQLISLRV